MEAQPELMLLQKTMLTAEGTSRKLCPEANMWFLARPLVEAWMIENIGPQARVRDTLSSLSDAAERLPRMMDNFEKSTQMMASGQLKLHPDTIRALQGDASRRPVLPSLWIIVLFLVVLVVGIKFF